VTLEDTARGQVKEAGKQIVQLGKHLGPVILNTTTHSFFSSVL
jgi:hypothetical protein